MNLIKEKYKPYVFSLSLLVTAMVPPVANASDTSEFNIHGKITEGACTLSITGTADLGTLSLTMIDETFVQDSKNPDILEKTYDANYAVSCQSTRTVGLIVRADQSTTGHLGTTGKDFLSIDLTTSLDRIGSLGLRHSGYGVDVGFYGVTFEPTVTVDGKDSKLSSSSFPANNNDANVSMILPA